MAQMYSAALMLDHLGQSAAGAEITAAVDAALRDGVRTRDLGGTAGTADVTAAVLARLDPTA